MDPIKIAIIGTGGIFRAHYNAYQKAGGFEIVAVWEGSHLPLIAERDGHGIDGRPWLDSSLVRRVGFGTARHSRHV